jgi:sigma-54 dependent transcriptional regulator, acetoin dehydrogenase operon transcriptional activator AcoR
VASARNTLSREIRADSAGERVAPHLFLTLISDRPTANSMRFSLHGVSEVVIGRADGETSKAADVQIGQGRLKLSVKDGWMSSTHAKLLRVYGVWTVEDAGSKNGTLVNGRGVRREALADGDVIELGHTFLLFRQNVAVPPGTESVVDGADLRPAAAGFATMSPSLAADFNRLEAIARSPIPVVIQGETGTGKEIVASSIHSLSSRPGPFLAINCGALPPSLIQSELFGHLKGAFTGAREEKKGIIQAADGGTLFLDEIGDLSPASQPLLLRVLQEGEVFPVGATRPVKVDVRVLAASHRDLWAFAAEKRFRSDLLARLSGVTVVLPPLRERREDLGLLIGAVLRRALGSAAETVVFTCEAARALFLYPWPLNVRELEKALQAAAIMASGKAVELEDLPVPIRQALHAATRPLSLGDTGQEMKQPRQPAEAAGPPPPPQMPLAEPPVLRSSASQLQHFIDEIWRRHVVRVVVAYSVAVLGMLQGADVIVTRLSLPPRWMTWFVVGSIAGLPIAAGLAWVFDWTRKGIVRTPPRAPGQPAPLALRRARKRLLAGAIGVLALVIAAGVLWWRQRPQ